MGYCCAIQATFDVDNSQCTHVFRGTLWVSYLTTRIMCLCTMALYANPVTVS